MLPVKAFEGRSARDRQSYPKLVLSNNDPGKIPSHLHERDAFTELVKDRVRFKRADWYNHDEHARVLIDTVLSFVNDTREETISKLWIGAHFPERGKAYRGTIA